MDAITYVGLDVHKATIPVGLAKSGRDGEVRQVGVFKNQPEIVVKLAARLSQGGKRLSLLRSRPLRLWAASAADRLRA